MSTWERVTDPVVDETVWCARTSRGLRVRVAPRPRFRETAAVITFGYGSTDLWFTDDRGELTTPAGTAHYLEHKLFEDEALDTFGRFAARGARVNAQTGFTRTSYHFTASTQFRDNLTDLLYLVGTPHITDANVAKERGIIAQEVRMYEDSPDYCTMFDLLGCLYGEHPVRYTVGGTVASIDAITAELLLRCWRAFYRTGNAALAVAGPVDPDDVLALAEACPLPAGAAPHRGVVADFGPVARTRSERAMSVARPKLLLGIKDATPAPTWEERSRRQLATRALQDRLFAASSEVRERLHVRGVVDDSLGAGYHGEKTFAFATIGCETRDPARVEAELRAAWQAPPPVDDEHLERIRRRHLGAFVRGCESMRALAFGQAGEALDDVPPFASQRLVAALTLADVQQRREQLRRDDAIAVAITRTAR
ncbi:MAG: insulinase family protein [Planctomycetes bacterium]|nr:insulinase family protein [Planctomycetota bacterium]